MLIVLLSVSKVCMSQLLWITVLQTDQEPWNYFCVQKLRMSLTSLLCVIVMQLVKIFNPRNFNMCYYTDMYL